MSDRQNEWRAKILISWSRVKIFMFVNFHVVFLWKKQAKRTKWRALRARFKALTFHIWPVGRMMFMPRLNLLSNWLRSESYSTAKISMSYPQKIFKTFFLFVSNKVVFCDAWTPKIYLSKWWEDFCIFVIS